jgi:hypothetical protein
MPERNHLQEEGFILAFGFRDYIPWLTSSIVSRPEVRSRNAWEGYGKVELFILCGGESDRWERYGNKISCKGITLSPTPH